MERLTTGATARHFIQTEKRENLDSDGVIVFER